MDEKANYESEVTPITLDRRADELRQAQQRLEGADEELRVLARLLDQATSRVALAEMAVEQQDRRFADAIARATTTAQ